MLKSWWATAWPAVIGALVGLLAAAVLFLVSSQPRGQAVRLEPPPSPPPLLVHVNGAVTRPGLVTLPPGSRVSDAIQAAGGLLEAADRRGLNLAAVLEDGQMLLIPTLPAPIPSGQLATPGAERLMEIPLSSTPTFPININSASQAELEALPGIGPVISQKIIDYRAVHGPFTSIEAIQDVAGIGPAIFEKIKDLITTGISP